MKVSVSNKSALHSRMEGVSGLSASTHMTHGTWNLSINLAKVNRKVELVQINPSLPPLPKLGKFNQC